MKNIGKTAYLPKVNTTAIVFTFFYYMPSLPSRVTADEIYPAIFERAIPFLEYVYIRLQTSGSRL